MTTRLLASILLLAVAMPASADDDLESAFRGKRLAEANCSGCHAIAQNDESALRLAPPFRELGSRFPAAELRAMLRGKVFEDHAVMPDFEPDEQQAADLSTYIKSIAETQGEGHEGQARRLHRM